METSQHPTNGDGILLTGADDIAVFLFGSKKYRRRVYHLVESGSLPAFKIGGKLCARKATLDRYIEGLEDAAGWSSPEAA